MLCKPKKIEFAALWELWNQETSGDVYAEEKREAGMGETASLRCKIAGVFRRFVVTV
jgi:hypothetical protein